MGHCLEGGISDQTRFSMHGDGTITDWRELNKTSPEKVAPYVSKLPPYTRVAHTGGHSMCTYSYAVSYSGAQKLLYAISVKELIGQVDVALAWWCDDHRDSCFTVWPPLFSTHHSRGLAGKNSDNEGSRVANKSSTVLLQWPVKMNFKGLLAGETQFENQYPEHLEEA